MLSVTGRQNRSKRLGYFQVYPSCPNAVSLVPLLTILIIIIAQTVVSPLSIARSPTRMRVQQRMRSNIEMLSKFSGEDDEKIGIALTREDGKNGKILKALQYHSQITSDSCFITEIPCIEHAPGPDSGDPFLTTVLKATAFDYIVITSPEAALVFSATWEQAKKQRPDDCLQLPKICAVGKATEDTLISQDIPVFFVPSKATAATLVEELPPVASGSTTNVLYPASAKAKVTLQNGLESRSDASFQVTRLNTYDTVPAVWSDAKLDLAQNTINIICFASPSAVDSWVEKVANKQNGKDVTRSTLAACIGETSAQACREKGWRDVDIFYPENPGVQGWADSVADAVLKLTLARTSVSSGL